MRKKPKPFDFAVQNHGTIFMLFPLTAEAETWVTAHLPAERTQWGGGTAVEHRCIHAIVRGIEADGLTLSGS